LHRFFEVLSDYSDIIDIGCSGLGFPVADRLTRNVKSEHGKSAQNIFLTLITFLATFFEKFMIEHFAYLLCLVSG